MAYNEEGNGNSGKSNGDKCGGRASLTRAVAMATAPSTRVVMATAMRLAGDKEGRARLARAMVTAMRVGGNKEGKGGKGNGDGRQGWRASNGNGNAEGNGNDNEGSGG